MKIILGIILFQLLTCGVFGAGINVPVSVMEGQTVTLNTDIIDIKEITRIMWRFETLVIAEFNNNKTTYANDPERFRDRLKLNSQTGTLTIMNIRTTDTGLYKAEINHITGTSKWLFNVTLSIPVPDSGLSPAAAAGIAVVVLLLVFAGAAAFMFYHRHKFLPKTSMILGKEGNNVTLNVRAELQRDDLILWMFGDENNLIAQMNGETSESTFTEADERFRDKLLLDKRTGSLTIRDITNEHSGAYKLHIISSKKSIYSSFRVFVFGESGPNTVSVMAGESLILITNFNIERGERPQWTFDEDEMLASGKNGDVRETLYGDDMRFRCRLELHHQSASLTVKNTRSSDSGVYQLTFWNRNKKNICLKVNVTVSDDTRNTLNESVNIQMPQSRNPE
ncbi:uncharacterized protein isoform X3 [Danio rerio]|uniref:Uncharacterized protein isoform X3 n=2 Tax=Danio rerio TaxID=7955 RepID=A0AC58IGM0_DANRE